MLIALVAALLANTASPTPTIAELAKLHRQAMGPMPASTARWTGSITRGDVVQPFTVNADSTGRYRGSWQTALGSTLVGSDGTVDWTQDESGAVESQPSNHSFSLGYEIARLDAYDFSDKHATVSGPSALDDRQVYALKIADPDNPMTLYIDAKTYLVDGADTSNSTIRYRTHKRFNGFEVPTQIDDTSGDQTTTRTIDSVTFGVDVARLFAPPASREPAFPKGSTDVSLTFDDRLPPFILIPVSIDGKTVHMLIDSGSSTSVIDADVAKRLGLPTAGVAQIEGANLITGTYARADTLDVGGIEFDPFILEAVPLDLPQPLKRDGIDGVLGYDFLEHVVARIAYYPRELQLIQPSAFTYSGTGAVMSIDLTRRVPTVTAAMSGNDSATFTVDTGTDQGLVLYDTFANSHPKDFTHSLDIHPNESAGVGGEVAARSVLVVQISLGQFTVNDVQAMVLLRSTGAFAPGLSDGLLGGGLLQAFRAVFLDYRGKRLILEK
ncbi:MAG TPA: retropepsin-like aspartic protease [Candidatus Eremiobacteraceae bacterium]|nr:retropepsin-like aspartic protease [Candidatus Eremiobacteraceae bacterium]